MAGSVLALSLFGLGVVQALPAASTLETRQVFIGDGTGVFVPLPDETLPPCLVSGSGAPQAPCLLPPIPGGITLPPGFGFHPKDKRDAEEAVEKRQFWIGDGVVGIWPGNGAPKKPCLVGVPLKEQPPCLLGPLKEKRGLETRQTLIIGGGGGTLPPGTIGGGLPVCSTSIPLSQQPPCFLPPISGGGLILPPKEKREAGEPKFVLPPDAASNPKKYIEKLELELIALQNKKYKTRADVQKIKDIKAALLYLVGITNISAPPGTGSTFTPGKRDPAFKLPPDAATNPKRVIEELERQLIALQNKKHKTDEDKEDIELIKAALLYVAGITNISAPPGTGSTFTPGKRDPAFKLPPDAATNPKRVLVELETRLIALQNKKYKTDEDREDIALIKAAILYVAGITNISAPPGTGSTFTPGKRDPAFKLPPDAATNPKRVLVELETRLIALQNKQHKTDEDREDIALIKAAILYVAGITNISAPPGTGSTFTPGKRQFKLPPDAASNPKKFIEQLEKDLIILQNKKYKTRQDRADIEAIKAALLYLAGITNISAPPGTGSTFTPGKRTLTLTPEFDLQGLITSYNKLVLSMQSSSGETSATTYLVLSQIADTLELYGYKVDRVTPTLVTLHPKRQANIITIGTTTCRGSDISGLKSALEALLSTYGDPSKAPKTIWFIQQVLVTALQLCGQGVEGWTTIIPAKPIPGAPLVPQPTVPGAPIVPDPYVPGAPIRPDPYVPGAPIKPDPYVPGNPIKPSD
ncbi:hypothetical protein QBC35DRAFT_195679 [Podospora australis]|uniref:Uncharacterized protein n=1 Tax=Podospora australis TaxID=1536484 RepID=A0AAN6WUX0_9PEZI|nr:hypothetical protein QBC35DRAFT_195679 [Podospora australis]